MSHSSQSWGELRRKGGTEVHKLPESAFILDADIVVFGRQPMNQDGDKGCRTYTLNVAYLSSKHFILKRQKKITDGENMNIFYTITSVGRNGTYVNKKLIPMDTECSIDNGDEVNIIFKGEEKMCLEFIYYSDNNIRSLSESLSLQKNCAIQANNKIQEEFCELKMKYDLTISRMEALTHDMTLKQNEITELKLRYSRLESDRNDEAMRVMELEASMSASDAKRQHCEKALSEQSTLIDGLRNKVRQLEGESSEVAVLLNRVKTLEYELEVSRKEFELKDSKTAELMIALDEETKSLHRMKRDMRDAIAECRAKDEKILCMEAASTALQEVVSHKEEDLAAAKVNTEQLQGCLSSVRSKRNEDRLQLSKAVESTKDLLSSLQLLAEEGILDVSIANALSISPPLYSATRENSRRIDATQVETDCAYSFSNVRSTSQNSSARGELNVRLTSSPPYESPRRNGAKRKSYSQLGSITKTQRTEEDTCSDEETEGRDDVELTPAPDTAYEVEVESKDKKFSLRQLINYVSVESEAKLSTQVDASVVKSLQINEDDTGESSSESEENERGTPGGMRSQDACIIDKIIKDDLKDEDFENSVSSKVVQSWIDDIKLKSTNDAGADSSQNDTCVAK